MHTPRVLFVNTTNTTKRSLERTYPDIEVHTAPHYYSYVGTQPEDSEALETYIANVLQYVEEKGIEAVVPSNDVGTFVAAIINHRAGLRGASEESVLLAGNKYLMRQHLDGAETVHSVRENVLPRVRFPMYLKAPYSAFGLFATTIDSQDALEKFVTGNWTDLMARNQCFFPHILSHLSVTKDYPGSIENMFYLESLRTHQRQVTVEGVVQDGEVTILAIVDSNLADAPGIFESFTTPSVAPKVVQDTLVAQTKASVTKLGLDHTVFNAEFWLTEDGRVDLIEVNPRISTSFARLYKAAYGLDVRQLAIAVALGTPVQTPAEKPVYAGLYNVRVPEDKRADTVFNFALASSMPEVAVRFSPDRFTKRSGHYGDVIADILITGNDWGEMQKEANQKIGALKL